MASKIGALGLLSGSFCAALVGCATHLAQDWAAVSASSAAADCALLGPPELRTRLRLDDGTSIELDSRAQRLGEGPGHSTAIWQAAQEELSLRYHVAVEVDTWARQRSNGLRTEIDGVDAEFFAYRNWSGDLAYALLPIDRMDLPVASFNGLDGDFEDAGCALTIARSIRWHDQPSN